MPKTVDVVDDASSGPRDPTQLQYSSGSFQDHQYITITRSHNHRV
jgi:hypothetical protein